MWLKYFDRWKAVIFTFMFLRGWILLMWVNLTFSTTCWSKVSLLYNITTSTSDLHGSQKMCCNEVGDHSDFVTVRLTFLFFAEISWQLSRRLLWDFVHIFTGGWIVSLIFDFSSITIIWFQFRPIKLKTFSSDLALCLII